MKLTILSLHRLSYMIFNMVSNLQSVDISGVGEPFLLLDMRYLCPIFCIF